MGKFVVGNALGQDQTISALTQKLLERRNNILKSMTLKDTMMITYVADELEILLIKIWINRC